MLTMHVSDIKWELLQETYRDSGRALDQLKRLDFDQDFQRLWNQVEQSKKEIMQAKETIEKISFGRKGQVTMPDITNVYNYAEDVFSNIKTEILPVLQDSRNPNPQTLKANLSGLSGEIYNLAVKKAEGELQTAAKILESIDDSQRLEEGPLHEYVGKAHEYVKKAHERLQQTKDGLESFDKGKAKWSPEADAQRKFEAFNSLAGYFKDLSQQFKETEILFKLSKMDLRDTNQLIKLLENAVKQYRRSEITAKGIFAIVREFHPPEGIIQAYSQLSNKCWKRIAVEQIERMEGAAPVRRTRKTSPRNIPSCPGSKSEGSS